MDEMEAILEEILQQLDGVIANVTQRLPPEFPSNVAEPIFQGLLNARDKFIRSRDNSGAFG
ncbi:hypothetical protein JCM31598_15270 [Desulfonatronum parangueonense]